MRLSALALLLVSSGVYIQSYNLYNDGLRLNQPVATGYADAVTHFAAAEEGDEVIYLRHTRVQMGSFLADAFRARLDGSGCAGGCPRISRQMPVGHEAVKIAVSRGGNRAAYIWGNRVANNWKIDLVDSDGTDRVAVQLGAMIAERGSPLEFSCDLSGQWLKFGAKEFAGAPASDWYVSSAGGAPVQIVDGVWPGSCAIFADGFESGDTGRWD